MKLFAILIFLIHGFLVSGQLDYGDMANWAFHPIKTGTLIDGFNLNIAVINEDLSIKETLEIENNAMTNTGVDVFFVHPTILQNIGSFTDISNVDIANQNSIMIQGSIRGQAGLFAKYGRFFAPRYRQATPFTFINSPLNDLQANVLGVAYNDVKAAFIHYLENYNNGNKIILISHSQGAYLAGFLLKDVIDSNPELRQKLVVAVIAGMIANYASPNNLAGGWWENIPFCSQQDECACVMNWRSYKEGQIPPAPIQSHPCFNPSVVSNGWAHAPLDVPNNWIMQDSLYYDNTVKPLRNFITLRSNVTFGGNVGYVAFDSLYAIRHLRSGPAQVGFMVQHTPKPGDERPDLLTADESTSSFSSLGYHIKDYNIYTWALLEQIDMKLAACLPTSSKENRSLTSHSVTVFPNPGGEFIYVKTNEMVLKNESINILDGRGKIVFTGKLDAQGGISISHLNRGLYLIKTDYGISKFLIR
jgi:hypothetical protein